MSKFFKINPKVIKRHARSLRREMTKTEQILWSKLRNRQLAGYKFLRQHPIIYKGDLTGLNYFIADFYCHEKRVIVELDGHIHDETQEYDQWRDEELKQKNIRVLRIRNEELTDLKMVLSKILAFLNS